MDFFKRLDINDSTSWPKRPSSNCILSLEKTISICSFWRRGRRRATHIRAQLQFHIAQFYNTVSQKPSINRQEKLCEKADMSYHKQSVKSCDLCPNDVERCHHDGQSNRESSTPKRQDRKRKANRDEFKSRPRPSKRNYRRHSSHRRIVFVHPYTFSR